MIRLRICDPLEEQLDLPAATIELGDGERCSPLVGNTRRLPVCGFLNLMRRSGVSKCCLKNAAHIAFSRSTLQVTGSF